VVGHAKITGFTRGQNKDTLFFTIPVMARLKTTVQLPLLVYKQGKSPGQPLHYQAAFTYQP